jgi:hypothetical protein
MCKLVNSLNQLFLQPLGFHTFEFDLLQITMQRWVRFSINFIVFEAENDARNKIKLPTFVQILKHEIENKYLTIGFKDS